MPKVEHSREQQRPWHDLTSDKRVKGLFRVVEFKVIQDVVVEEPAETAENDDDDDDDKRSNEPEVDRVGRSKAQKDSREHLGCRGSERRSGRGEGMGESPGPELVRGYTLQRGWRSSLPLVFQLDLPSSLVPLNVILLASGQSAF